MLDGAPAEDERRDPLLAAADVLRVDTQEAELVTGTSIEGAGDAIQAGQQVLRAGPSLAVLGAAADGNVAVWEGGAAVLPHVDVDVGIRREELTRSLRR